MKYGEGSCGSLRKEKERKGERRNSRGKLFLCKQTPTPQIEGEEGQEISTEYSPVRRLWAYAGSPLGNLASEVGLMNFNLRRQRKRRMGDRRERKCRQRTVWFPNALRGDTTNVTRGGGEIAATTT